MRYLIAALLMTVVAGCSLDRPYPDKQLFVLRAQLEASEASAASSDASVLRVSRAVVATPFGSRAMQYRVADDRYEPDYYNAWADDPGHLVSVAVIGALDTTGRWGGVLDDTSVARDARKLELYVDALYADVRDSASTIAVLGVRVTLMDPDGSVLLTQRYEETTEVKPGDAGALVEGWNRLLSSVLSRYLEESLSL